MTGRLLGAWPEITLAGPGLLAPALRAAGSVGPEGPTRRRGEPRAPLTPPEARSPASASASPALR